MARVNFLGTRLSGFFTLSPSPGPPGCAVAATGECDASRIGRPSPLPALFPVCPCSYLLECEDLRTAGTEIMHVGVLYAHACRLQHEMLFSVLASSFRRLCDVRRSRTIFERFGLIRRERGEKDKRLEEIRLIKT